MGAQIVTGGVHLVAHDAAEAPLAPVPAQVVVQLTLLDEGLRTQCALVRLHACRVRRGEADQTQCDLLGGHANMLTQCFAI